MVRDGEQQNYDSYGVLDLSLKSPASTISLSLATSQQSSPATALPSPLPTAVDCKCRVCGAHATGFHFQAQSCSACCAFFRRSITLRKSYRCLDKSKHTVRTERCPIVYTDRRICKSCRLKKCLDVGMDPNVHEKKPATERARSFSTKSGVQRNKLFATLLMQQEPPAKSTPRLKDGTTTGFVASSSVFTNQREYKLLGVFIDEEMRIAERRRILFCERAVGCLLGTGATCAYTRADIAPLNFGEFRKSIRSHILLIYEWLRVWPAYASLNSMDQITFLRKCALYHTILDPCFITLQVGDEGKFVLQNGGYVSTSTAMMAKDEGEKQSDVDGNSEEGWEDEEEITSENKKKIYRPLLTLLKEIVDRMVEMRLCFEEFVALKAMISIQMTIPDLSSEGRVATRRELESLVQDLCRVVGIVPSAVANRQRDNSGLELEKAVRFGGIIMLMSTILDTANNFVESHHQVTFFDLWQLDSLMLQFLKNRV